MEIELSDKTLSDLTYWKKSAEVKVQKGITPFIGIYKDSFNGIVKPELSKYELAELWSRRIDKGNRII